MKNKLFYYFVSVYCIFYLIYFQNLPYLPLNEAQLGNTNKRFQQLMQGGSQSDVAWPQPPKFKTEKLNIKAEIDKLNSSIFNIFNCMH